MKLAAALAIAGAMLLMTSAPALSKCGTRGGPGYRDASGNCVGWDAIARQCGSPPTTHCTAERVANGADDAAEKGSEIQELKARARKQKNQTAP